VNEADEPFHDFENRPAGMEYFAMVLPAFGEVGCAWYNDEDLQELFLPERSFCTSDPGQNLDGNCVQMGRNMRILDPTKYTAISTRKVWVN
jgi:hypothetical protein